MRAGLLIAFTVPASVAALAGCGSCSGETPGEPVAELWGIAMPEGTRRILEEEGTGFDGLSFTTVWLATHQDPAAVAAFFGEASDSNDTGAMSFSFPDGRISVAPIGEIPQTNIQPRRPVVDDEPDGMEAWIVAYHEVSASCPPCPEGFVGTTVPGCTCDGPEVTIPLARYKEGLRGIGPGWFVTFEEGGTFRSEDASCMGTDAIRGTYDIIGERVELTPDDDREPPERILHVREHEGTTVLLRERQLDAFELDPSLLFGLVDEQRLPALLAGGGPESSERQLARAVVVRVQRDDGRWLEIEVEPVQHLVDINACTAPAGRTRCSRRSYVGRLMEDGWAELVRLQQGMETPATECPPNEGTRQFALDRDTPTALPSDLSEENLAVPCNAGARLALWALDRARGSDERPLPVAE